MRAKHKNAIATLRSGHPVESVGHTHKLLAFEPMVRSGLREKAYAYTRQAEDERTQSTPGSNLLLEVQTVKPLELLDEGLVYRLR